MKRPTPGTHTKRYPSKAERTIREEFFELFENCPIPKDELLLNLGLFIKRQDLSRILFMHELYKKIITLFPVKRRPCKKFSGSRAIGS